MPNTIRFVIGLTFRSIELFFDDLATVREAMMSRGVSFTKCTLKEKIERNYRLGIPLILIMLRRANDIAFALDARRFRIKGVKVKPYIKANLNTIELLLTLIIWFTLIFVVIEKFIFGVSI